MPITPSPETLRQLEALGVTRPVPQIHKPTAPAFTANRPVQPAFAVAPVARIAPAHAASPVAATASTTTFDLIASIDAFIRWFFGGVVVAALVGTVLFALRLSGVFIILVCFLGTSCLMGQDNASFPISVFEAKQMEVQRAQQPTLEPTPTQKRQPLKSELDSQVRHEDATAQHETAFADGNGQSITLAVEPTTVPPTHLFQCFD